MLRTIENVMALMGSHDEDTKNHCRRVGVYTYVFMCYLHDNVKGLLDAYHLDEDAIKDIVFSAYVHDVGKIMIPPHILQKTGKLTDEEWEEIRKHPDYGAQYMSKLGFETILDGIRDHQEKINGSGYPHKLSGRKISLAGRIIAIIDAFDVITERRHYDTREIMGLEEAIEEINKSIDVHFDEEVAMLFIQMCRTYNVLAVKESPEIFEQYCHAIMEWATEKRHVDKNEEPEQPSDAKARKLLRQISVDKNK